MYRLLLPLAFAAAALPLHAYSSPTEGPALTLVRALSLAAQPNPVLAGARHELQEIAGTVVQAGARPNPSLAIGVEDLRGEQRETTVQFSQSIELGNQRAHRMAAAEKAHDGAALALRAKWSDIRAEVTRAFYDLLVAQERLKLADDSARNAQGSTSIAAKRVVAGKISPVDETKARVAEALVRLELLQAQSDWGTGRERLIAALGTTSARLPQIAGALEDIPPFRSAKLDWAARVLSTASGLANRGGTPAGVPRSSAAGRRWSGCPFRCRYSIEIREISSNRCAARTRRALSSALRR